MGSIQYRMRVLLLLAVVAMTSAAYTQKEVHELDLGEPIDVGEDTSGGNPGGAFLATQGKFQLNAGNANNAAATVNCAAGKYKEGNTCKNCAKGKFTTTQNAEECTNCNKGQYGT